MAHDNRTEFSVRGLLELSKRINEDPSLVEGDWRIPFYDTFELTASQRALLDGISAEEQTIVQEAFNQAAKDRRRGQRIRLHIVNDLENGRRALQLATFDEALARGPVREVGFAIVCCCADCCCWHWCWKRNPCGHRQA